MRAELFIHVTLLAAFGDEYLRAFMAERQYRFIAHKVLFQSHLFWGHLTSIFRALAKAEPIFYAVCGVVAILPWDHLER